MNRLNLGHVNRATWLFGSALVLVFIAYSGGLLELYVRWNKQEEYSHGFFIPIISLWLLWQRRVALEASMGQPAWQGLVLIVVALTMLILGELTAIFILVQYGFLVCLIGLVLCFGGKPLLRKTFLPIALLIFAIPLPYFVDSQLSWRLQLLSSKIGVEVLRLFGTSVFLEGNVIDLGIYRLQVVEACSGLRYLYPLLSIGFLMAYMYTASTWKRSVLFLATIPVTVLMNSIRIAAVGLLVNQWGIGMADGFLHYFEGWIVFLVCLSTLLGLIWVFERFGERRTVVSVLVVPEVAVPNLSNRPTPAKLLPLSAALVLIALAAAMVFFIDDREEVIPERQSFVQFPRFIDNWRANESRMDTRIESSLGVDDYFLADYHDLSGRTVNFYVAYYASQRKGISPHSPQVCIPGGGWLIVGLGQHSIDLGNGQTISVTRVLIEKAGKRQLVYYWFEQRGRQIANEYWMKLYLLIDAVVRNRTDGALVRVTTQIGESELPETADARLREFLQLATPQLPTYVPK